MRFALDGEQTAFAATLDRLLTAAGTPAVVRAWAAGEPGPGRELWGRLAGTGVFALAVPTGYGGLGPLPVEVVCACVELGRHAVPGPVAEAVAVAALLGRLGERAAAGAWLPRIADGRLVPTLAAPGGGPYALDADAADVVFAVDEDGTRLRVAAGHGAVQPSLDPARRLARPAAGGEVVARGEAVRRAAAHALDWARLAVAAQALGAGRALLDRTVAQVRRRTQFGRPVGSFQAVKHRLADVLLALEFAGPVVYDAAVALAGAAPDAGARVAVAKAQAGEAAYAAGRAALQLHGAIGYTAEFDLSLWLGKARALRSAWGGVAQCRARALELTSMR